MGEPAHSALRLHVLVWVCMCAQVNVCMYAQVSGVEWSGVEWSGAEQSGGVDMEISPDSHAHPQAKASNQ